MTQERLCKFCRTPAVLISDNPARQLYECPDIACVAVEVISKGESSWWYHGAQRPDGSAIDADGHRRQRNSYGWWDNPDPL